MSEENPDIENEEIKIIKEQEYKKDKSWSVLLLICIVIGILFSTFSFSKNNTKTEKHKIKSTGYFEVLENSYGKEAVPLNENEIFLATGHNGDAVLPAQVYNIKEREFKSLNSFINTERFSEIVTSLDDGRILILGGYGKRGIHLKSAEIYDIKENKFKKIGDSHFHHNTLFSNFVKMKNGKIFIIHEDQAEIFDPQTNKFYIAGKETKFYQKSVYDKNGEQIRIRTTNNIYERKTAIALLNDGRVLVLGPNYDLNSNNAEIYDPETNSFETVGSQNFPMFNREATTLNDGKVLVTGGTKNYYKESTIPEVKSNDANWSGDEEIQDNNAEIFDPKTNQFTAISPLNITRHSHRTILLSNGKVLIVKGTNNLLLKTKAAKQAELFDPKTNSFSKISLTNNGSYDLQIFSLNSHEVLIVSASGWELYKY